MAFSIVNACGGYGQLGFIGSENWIIADASTLTVLQSGANTEQVVANAACAMIAPETMIGISSPNVANGDCFGFLIQNGTFSTFALPSLFTLTSTSVLFAALSQSTDIAPENSWFSAFTSSNTEPYFLNLGVIAGLASGVASLSVSGNSNFEAANQPGAFYSNGYIYSLNGGNNPSVAFVEIDNTTNVGNISLPQTPEYSQSAVLLCCNLGPFFAYVTTTTGQVVVSTWEGKQTLLINSTTFPTTKTILGTTAFLFNFQGTLFIVNPTAQLACSIDVVHGLISPIYSFDIDPAATEPGIVGYDQDTGIIYCFSSGSSANQFGNLSPMAF